MRSLVARLLGRGPALAPQTSPAEEYGEVTERPPGTMNGALRNLSRRIEVATVVDVGASDGRWSVETSVHYPDAAYLLIEALADPHEAALRRLCGERSSMQYVIAAAGPREGQGFLHRAGIFDSAASVERYHADDLVVPMTTVDAEVARCQLAPPYLLKLDTHGFEREIFAGAELTLAAASLVVVEAYNFEIRTGCLRIHELCAFLEERGLRCADIVDIVRRPGDGFLWQCDLLFARAERPEFAAAVYD